MKIPHLEPRKYKIVHEFNEYTYFAEWLMYYDGVPKWYLMIGTSAEPFWRIGYKTPEELLEAFNLYYSSK